MITPKSIDIDEKKCSKCSVIKPLSKFHKKKGSRDGFTGHCGECINTRYREYRSKNIDKIIIQTRSSVKRSRERLLAWLREYKSARGCADCGETHPACLDFHHENPLEKMIEFGKQYTYSKERYEQEIKKCIILCANCHRKRHFNPINVDIGEPEVNPGKIVEPVHDPVPRETPIPVPSEPVPHREPVPA